MCSGARPSAGTNMPANAVITLTLMASVRISRGKPPMAFPCRFRARCRERHICGIRNIDWAIYRPTQPVSCFDRHISNRESSTSNEMEWTGDCSVWSKAGAADFGRTTFSGPVQRRSRATTRRRLRSDSLVGRARVHLSMGYCWAPLRCPYPRFISISMKTNSPALGLTTLCSTPSSRV